MLRHARRSTWALLVIIVFNVPSHSAGTKLMPVSKNQLCVTEGAIEESTAEHLSVNVPKMRAYVKTRTPQSLEVRFTYLGATDHEARLGSGELRRQFGLKLRAQDACNLVYAMWRIEPESKLVVSVKANPNEHSSAQCGNRGYRNIKPRQSRPVPVLRSGESHNLLAEMDGDEVRVFADNTLVWDGNVGNDALAFDGPVGLRSDNARLQLQISTAEPLSVQPHQVADCKTGDSD